MPFMATSTFLHCIGTKVSLFTITVDSLQTGPSENGILVGTKFPYRAEWRRGLTSLLYNGYRVLGGGGGGLRRPWPGTNHPLPSFSAKVLNALELEPTSDSPLSLHLHSKA
jgi:hypothetical protein